MVYKATVNGVTVAAKTIQPNTERNLILALLAEIKIMSLLEHHPNIVGLVGAHTSDLDKGTNLTRFYYLKKLVFLLFILGKKDECIYLWNIALMEVLNRICA